MKAPSLKSLRMLLLLGEVLLLSRAVRLKLLVRPISHSEVVGW